jgi:hypothetical protein
MYYYIIELIYKLLHQFELVIFIETVLFYFKKYFEMIQSKIDPSKTNYSKLN